MTIPAQFISLIRQECSRPVPPSIKVLAEKILARYGDAVQAILFYGSCFRMGDDAGGIVDLYVLVDEYGHAYRKYSYSFLNKLLPPNVFYLEAQYEGRTIRSKYAVFSLKDFQRGTSMRWFHSYLWSRLAQPMGLIYVSDTHITERIYTAMARAVLSLITRVLPIMSSQFNSRELWCKGLKLTYAAELRAERQEKLVELFDTAPDYYGKLTRIAMTLVPFSVNIRTDTHDSYYRTEISAPAHISSRIAWTVRRIQGKALSILRLLKGLLTFEDGLAYILWKIERHSGITAEVNPRLRKIPLVGIGILFRQLYRRGAFK